MGAVAVVAAVLVMVVGVRAEKVILQTNSLFSRAIAHLHSSYAEFN